jgi:Kef-type K+ transport system membrane component KefB
MENVLLTLVLLLLLGRSLGFIFQRYGYQSLLGEVLAGIIIGPILIFQDALPFEELRIFSELGILMLMLLAGLTTDFEAFREHKIASIVVGSLGVIVTFFLILIPMYFLLGPIYDISFVSALFISAIISNTAIEVSAAVLMDSKRINLKAVIIGASFVDDILAVFLIGLVSPMAFEGEVPPIGDILFLSILVIAFLVITLIFATRIFEVIFNKLKGREGKVTLTATLITGFAFAFVASIIGLHEVIGAYIAGLIIGKWGSEVTPTLRRRIAWEKLKYDIDTPIRAIFGPLFFGFIGISVARVMGGDQINLIMVVPLILVLLVLAVAGKVFGCGLGARLSKFNKNDSVLIGTAMCGRGALELVLVNYAFSIDLIDETIFTALVVMTVLTVILTPILYNIINIYEDE